MSSWTIPGIKAPCTAGWDRSSFSSAPKERRVRYGYRPKSGNGLTRRSWKQEIHLPLRQSGEALGPRPSPCTARERSKRTLELNDHVSANLQNPFEASPDCVERQSRMDFESSKELNDELGSSKSRFAPFCSNLGMPSRGRSLMNHAFAGGYDHERQIIHKEVVRRLNSVGAANKSGGFNGVSGTESNSLRSTSFEHSSDDINFLEKGRYGPPEREHECHQESVTADSLDMGKLRVQPLKEQDDHGRWARRSLLNQCIPAILEKLGLNFSFKNLATNQGPNSLYNVNVTVSYEMRYQLASEGGTQFMYRSETGHDFAKHNGKLPYLTTDSMEQVARPVNFFKSAKSSAGGIPKAVHQLKGGRNPSFLSNPYSNAQVMFPHPGGERKPGRFWLQADGDVNPPQSTMWRDMFTIIGLSAFIVCGTRQPSVIELTNCNFETSVSKKPTFVLFYAPWCSHCQQLEHTWKDLACRLPKRGFDVQLAQIDAEKYCQVAEKYKVIKYPTLIFFKDGKAGENHNGPRDMDSLMTFIDENYSA